MTNDANVLKNVVEQLQSSGIQFSIKFIGSVAFDTSINCIDRKYQEDVAHSCIKLVVREAGASNKNSSTNADRVKHLKNAKYDIYNKYIDINISSSEVLLIESSDSSMEILRSFKTSGISFVSVGKDDFASFICFFANICDANGAAARRCFVFDGNSCVTEIRDVFDYVFRINEIEDAERNAQLLSIHSAQISEDVPEIFIDDVLANDGPPPLPLSKPPENCPYGGRYGRGFAEQPSTSANDTTQYSMFGRNRNPPKGVSEGLTSHHQQCSANNNRQRSVSSKRNSKGEDDRTANIWNQSWFHGEMSRPVAESLLQKTGHFLVRLSPNGANQFVLSGRSPNGSLCHIALMEEDGKMSLGGRFKTIVGLIYYCCQNSEFLRQHGISLVLEQPVERQNSFIHEDENN